MASCWVRIKKQEMNKILGTGSHSPNVPTELRRLCFLLSFVSAVQISAAGVWSVSPSLSLACSCGGVNCLTGWILIYCGSWWQQRWISSSVQSFFVWHRSSASVPRTDHFWLSHTHADIQPVDCETFRIVMTYWMVSLHLPNSSVGILNWWGDNPFKKWQHTAERNAAFSFSSFLLLFLFFKCAVGFNA